MCVYLLVIKVGFQPQAQMHGARIAAQMQGKLFSHPPQNQIYFGVHRELWWVSRRTLPSFFHWTPLLYQQRIISPFVVNSVHIHLKVIPLWNQLHWGNNSTDFSICMHSKELGNKSIITVMVRMLESCLMWTLVRMLYIICVDQCFANSLISLYTPGIGARLNELVGRKFLFFKVGWKRMILMFQGLSISSAFYTDLQMSYLRHRIFFKEGVQHLG